MAALSCRRCATTFDTRATTATRCPSCRAVVHLSRRDDGAGALRSDRSAHAPRSRAETGTGDSDPNGAVWGDLVVLAAFVAAGALVVVLVRRWWDRRQKRATPGVTDARRPTDETPGVVELRRPCSICGEARPGCQIVGCPSWAAGSEQARNGNPGT